MTPEGWRDVGILDVADVASGQVDPRETPYCDWPLVAPNHIEEGTGRLLPASSAAAQGAISGKYTFQPGDVLYSKIRPYLRKVALPRFSGLCSADMYPLRSNGEVEPGFLFAMLLSKEFTEFASSVSMRTGIPKINREELAKYRCNLPPLPEQRKIAAILSSVDDAIEASQAVIDQLQVVKKAMMAELLTKGLPGRHKKFKQTEIGQVPEEWEVAALGDLLSSGPDNGLYKHLSAYGDGVRIVRIDAFSNGEIVAEDELRRVRIDDTETERFRLATDDILINRVNSLSHLGKVGFVQTLSEPAVFESNMMRLTVNKAKVLPEFAFAELASERAREHFLSRAKQAVAQASINQQDVKCFPILLPGLTEQQAIVESLATISRRMHREAESLNALVNAKSALMSVLLTGEVRVRVDEEAAA